MTLFTLRSTPYLPTLCAALLLSLVASLSGCQLFETPTHSVLADDAIVRIKGVTQSSHIGKNPAGMPMIEANNFHDLLFTLGYSHASDRLTQMVELRLLAQGRLAELQGVDSLKLDYLMRSINLSADAQTLYKNTPKELQAYFAVYARGVNAYLYQMRDALPPALARANYQPDYWKAEDSALLFALFSFSQSGNLAEEVLALALAQQLDKQQLPWLFPISADEPLAFNEADKLFTAPRAALKHSALRASTLELLDSLNHLSRVNSLQAPLASSWVAHPAHTVRRRSLLALNTLATRSSDTTAAQPTQTAPYSWITLYSPQLQAAGLSVPGIPLLFSGFNGTLAYSLSAVMADTQDIFIEQLRRHNGRLEYRSGHTWQPARQRMETFLIHSQRPVRKALYSSARGPLLTSLASNSRSGFALALQRAALAEDSSLDALWQLLRSPSVEQATQILPKLRSLPANVLLADAQHIAWQVTGSYPNRRNSRGLFPSVGWDSKVAWEGYADPMLYPFDQDPAQGWLSAANQRLTQPGYGMQLSSSWASPERAENLAQRLSKKPLSASLAQDNTAQQRPWLMTQLQQMLTTPGMPEALKEASSRLASPQRTAAQQALRDFLALPAQQPLSNDNALWLEHFLAQTQAQLFKAELQPLPASVQHALSLQNEHSYSAWLDHLLGRDDSPFWQAVAGGKAQFILDNLVSSRQTTAQAPVKSLQSSQSSQSSQSMWVDFSRTIPLSAASFSGQSDNPYSPYFTLKAGTAGQAYPLPLNYKDISAIYGKQRLTLLPLP